MYKLTELPKDLLIPVDDGACNHLLRISLPSIASRQSVKTESTDNSANLPG